MITAIVIAQIDPEAVNEKIETALEDDEEFQKKIAEQKKELDKLRQEIKSIKANPKKPIDPKRKEQLRKEIAAVVKETEKRKSEKKQSQTIQGQVVKVKDDLAKLMQDLEEAEEEWELMKDPEKFATMVVKQSGSGAGGDLEPTFIESTGMMGSTTKCQLPRSPLTPSLRHLFKRLPGMRLTGHGGVPQGLK
jgi:hypothetical protein